MQLSASKEVIFLLLFLPLLLLRDTCNVSNVYAMKLNLILLKKKCFSLSTKWDCSDLLVQRINVPTVEEALVEIQGKLDSCNFQSSISTSNYRKSRYESNTLDPSVPYKMIYSC